LSVCSVSIFVAHYNFVFECESERDKEDYFTSTAVREKDSFVLAHQSEPDKYFSMGRRRNRASQKLISFPFLFVETQAS
jgi:hypothetical protein